METIQIDPADPDPNAIARAAEIIRGGGIVAFPTETVYGLGGNAFDATAIARIFEAKGRPAYNPLIVHCADAGAARRLARSWSGAAEALASALWPGPLTLVVEKVHEVPDEVTAGLPTVGVRVPRHPVARALLVAAGVPIAAPSANRFTELSPTSGVHVSKGLDGRIDLLLDSGSTEVGIESTVVDVTGDEPVLLRPGSIDPTRLAAIAGIPIVRAAEIAGQLARPSPGMLDRHYAPRSRLMLIPPGGDEPLSAAVTRATDAGLRVGALLRELPAHPALHRCVRMPAAPGEYARGFYSALHAMDDAGMDVVLVESPPEEVAWLGIRDRLARAAHPAS